MADGMMGKVQGSQGLDEMMGNWREEIKGKQRGLFSFEDIVERKIKDLKKYIYKEMIPADEWEMRQAYYKKVGEYEFVDPDWRPIKVGENWGGYDMSCFFRQKIRIPEEMKGEKVALMVYFGGDSLLSINGVPYQGMDPFRNLVMLTQCAEGGEEYEIDVESYYMWHHGESEIKKLECSYIVAFDQEIEKIYWDYKAAFKGLTIVDISEELKSYLTSVLKEAISYIRLESENREEILRLLKKGEAILKEKVFECDKFKMDGVIDLIGHSHLDVVFLWTYDEFVRKLGRTHASMLRLMEQYPEFIFSQSQPAMYKEMKKNYPAIFEQVKERIKEGRWEAIGGMWVEPDCNLISGESMVRQLLFGKRFYQKEFGVDTRTCWLPDVFGNCYTMPQILKKSGIDYFVTHKMGVWNDTNPWKHHTFWWEGPDGSRVFAVQPPTHFIGTMEPDHLSLHWSRYSDKDTVGESMFCYGWGDGGGGVDPEMLEYVERYSDFPGLPKTQTRKAEDSLADMYKKAKNLPVWKDELYLEAHRGVHTTKGKLKKNNRYCENLYRDAEIYSSIAHNFGTEYPQEELNEGWELVLTNQFHDSLPGSHTHKVYLDLLEKYEIAIASGEKIRKSAIEAISKQIGFEAVSGKAAPIVLFNSLEFESSRHAYIDAKDGKYARITDLDGNVVSSQRVHTLEGEDKIVFFAEKIPAVGYAVYFAEWMDAPADEQSVFEVSVERIENDYFIVQLDTNGELVSIYDKEAGRELLTEDGRGNVFRLYEDIPSKYEAWDIVETYLDTEFDIKDGTVELGDNGPVLCSLILKKSFMGSALRQKMILYKDVKRIDFETEVDWVERLKLLKVDFNVDLMAKNYTSDIAYGNIERSAYRSNSFDKAKFEVNAHYWVDLSESGYGVSILNDCKYGYSIKENKMTVTLLKGPTNPDPESDIETHYFTYSLYPHMGSWREGETNQKGLEFNNPLYAVALDGSNGGGSLPARYSFMDVENHNVTLEAVKQAEDSDEVIVRVVERFGKRSNASIRMFNEIEDVRECDLMEKELSDSDVSFDGNTIAFTIRPYEIKTFKVSCRHNI